MIDTREKFADVFEITDAELKYSLEERQIIIKQFQDEMKSIISTLRNYVSELKYMVDNKLDVSAITHLTFGVDSHLLNAFPVIYKYRECIVMYLLDDNYQMNHDLWNELKNIAEELIKNMNRVKDQRLYYDHYEPAYDFFEHRITQEGLLKFPDCYTELIQEIDCSRYTGMDLMNVLYVALSHIRDLMADIKDSSNYYENDTLEKIYNLNYDLFVRMYWPEREEGFRPYVTALQKGQINEEYLYERRSREILNFEGNSLGIIWRDFEHDKANLALKLKNKSLSDDNWIIFFNTIKRFDEYKRWIEELEASATSVNRTKKKKRIDKDSKPREEMTFNRGSKVLDAHLTLLYDKLTKEKWIEGNEVDFKALFSGKRDPNCIMIWKNTFGKATLFALFKALSDEKLIIIPRGYALSLILEGHFKDKSGNWLSGLDKGNKPSVKSIQIIKECVLLMRVDISGLYNAGDHYDEDSQLYDPYDHQDINMHKR